jgi:endonuclease/exonuclease/phosphatase family metal-dependent hydrolase
MRGAKIVLALAGLMAGLFPASAAPPDRLTVMTFNIWLGGARVDFARVAEAVETSGADVVAVQEADGNLAVLADLLGWRYYDLDLDVVSKYPVYPREEAGSLWTDVAVDHDRVVAVANVHLPAFDYGPELVRDGAPLPAVLDAERRMRVPYLDFRLPPLAARAAAGVPVVVAGDFNSPSHADWTAAAVGTRFHVAYPVDWPVTRLLESAGFADAWRTANPDPVVSPGLTWTPGMPAPKVPERETHDRIDMIWSAGPLALDDVRIVGEEGGPEVALAVSPWPSDHRALVAAYHVTPAPGDAAVATIHRAFRAGARIDYRFLVPAAAPDLRPVLVLPDGSREGLFTPGEGPRSEDGALETAGWTPGAYRIALATPDGDLAAETPVWVLPADAVPAVSVPERVTEGEPVAVAFSGAPARRSNFLGIFRAEETNIYAAVSKRPTDALPAGTAVFDESLPPGRYVARLLEDDRFVVLAEAPFEVAPP